MICRSFFFLIKAFSAREVQLAKARQDQLLDFQRVSKQVVNQAFPGRTIFPRFWEANCAGFRVVRMKVLPTTGAQKILEFKNANLHENNMIT